MRRYDPAEIEPKWVRIWEEEGRYRASEDPADPRPRFYALDMFLLHRVLAGPGTPAEMAARLELLEQRPINNVADATNYTLQEMGHPTH